MYTGIQRGGTWLAAVPAHIRRGASEETRAEAIESQNVPGMPLRGRKGLKCNALVTIHVTTRRFKKTAPFTINFVLSPLLLHKGGSEIAWRRWLDFTRAERSLHRACFLFLRFPHKCLCRLWIR